MSARRRREAYESREKWTSHGSHAACNDVGRMKKHLLVVATAVALAIPAAAHADERTPAEGAPAEAAAAARPVAPPTHRDLLVTLGAGAFGDGVRGDPGTAGTVLALYRTGPLALGGTIETGGHAKEYTYLGFAPTAGVFAPTPRWLSLGLLGSLGAHHYDVRDGEASGTTPFVGARIVTGVELGGSARLFLGLQAFWDHDLARQHVVQVSDGPPGDYGGATQYDVGTFRWGGLLAAGGAFDL